MFPQLRERFGSALDIVVEFSTLGEYRLGADGALYHASALTRAVRKQPARPDAQRAVSEHEPQLGGAGVPHVARAAVRRIVAGGAAGQAPVATPAAKRLLQAASAPGACRGERHRPSGEQASRRPARPGKPVAPEQLCLAV